MTSLTTTRSHESIASALTAERFGRAVLGAPRCDGCGQPYYPRVSILLWEEVRARYCRLCLNVSEAAASRERWES